MRRTLLSLLLALPLIASTERSVPSYHVGRIRTDMGEILFVLSDETPVHQASFIKFASHHYWDTLTFNRVIKNFVAQGGCPDTPQGFGAFPNLLAPEFRPNLRHVYGAVGAGTDGNKQSLDPGCQFYIVVNKDGEARLDDHFTVFGQVFKGMDVVEAIVSVPKDTTNNPYKPIKLHVDVTTMTSDELAKYGFVPK
jgi:peptidyl-prolyl cis-trans isomerase B (cyclophilin B)